MSAKHKVRVIYKSGATVDLKCEEFKVSRRANGLSVEWKNAEPNPLLFGIDDIAAVWQLS